MFIKGNLKKYLELVSQFVNTNKQIANTLY